MSDANDSPRQGSNRPGGPAAGFSAARGAALIALAVILGVVLLNAIDDGTDAGSSSSGGSSTTSTTGTGSTPGSGDPDTSSTSAAGPLPPALVTVRVLNGSGVAGAAGRLTDTLRAKGYKTLVASDAEARNGTVVDVRAGKTAECEAVAEFVTGAKVQDMPATVPGGQDADCIVILGS